MPAFKSGSHVPTRMHGFSEVIVCTCCVAWRETYHMNGELSSSTADSVTSPIHSVAAELACIVVYILHVYAGQPLDVPAPTSSISKKITQLIVCRSTLQ